MTHQQHAILRLILVITGLVLAWFVLAKLIVLIFQPIANLGGVLGFLGWAVGNTLIFVAAFIGFLIGFDEVEKHMIQRY